MKITARGIVRHHFHGDYWAAVHLVFPNTAEAKAAHASLPDWTHESAALVIATDSAGLDAVQETLRAKGEVAILPCGWRHCPGKGKRCKATGIDALTHSIDHGPPFEWTAEVAVVDPRQTTFDL